jgi:HlyD family secretion protein
MGSKFRRLIHPFLLSIGAILLLAQTGVTQESAAASIRPEVGPIQKTVRMSGYFAPTLSVEVSVPLESNLSLKVIKAVEHGSTVRAGDLLVEFDARDAKEQLEQQESALALQKLSLEEAEREERLARVRDPIDEQFAELAKQHADEDFAFFRDRELTMNQRSVEQSMKSMKDYLDYNAEELRQLEKMYKADDLTEESEEIVLRRAKDDLERARFALDREELNYQRSIGLILPRDKVYQQTQHRFAEIALEQFKLMRPLMLEKRQLSLKKQRMDFEKAARELDKLRSDLAKFRIEAPQDGTVYYGKCADGRFANIAEMQAKLRPHGTVGANEVLMTIVRNGPLSFVGTVPESEAPFATNGSVASVIPSGFPQLKLEAKIQRLAPVPGPDGTFAVHLELQVDAPKKVVAGMTGKAKWVAYFNAKALTVPSRVVHQDADNDDANYVFVLDGATKPVKQWVEVGIVSGERTEILSGLTADDNLVESDGSKK